MSFDITLNYALILSIIFMILSFRVIDLRGSPVTKFLHAKGSKPDPDMLQRAIRGHGNFSEYVPFFLILLFLSEVNSVPSMKLHIAGGMMTAGRVIHGIGFAFMKRSIPMRIGGTALTFLSYYSLIAFNLL